MRPDQLESLISLSAPAGHPSGSHAVVAVSHPSFAVDAEVGQLWKVPLDGGTARRITRGFRDSSPKYSANGELLAFLRAGQGEPSQLFVLRTDGGEAVQVTNQKLGVSDFQFNNDGSQLVFVSRMPEEGRYGTVNDIDAGHEPPRAFNRYQTRHNGLGWYRDRPAQVFVVDVPDPAAEPVFAPAGQGKAQKVKTPEQFPKARRLTNDDVDWSSPIFDADGSVLACANRKGDDTLEEELWKLTEGQEPESLTAGLAITARGPIRSGDHLYFAAGNIGEGLDFIGHHGTVWLAEKTPRQLIDITVGGRLAALPNGRIAVPEVYRGTQRAVLVGPNGHTVIEDETWDVQSLDAAGDELVATVTSATSMGELAVLRDGRWEILTAFGAPLADAVSPQPLTATSPDGYPVEGWLLKPTTPGPHPVLLLIHGGPYSAYSRSFFDEAQVAVEAGYAVVMCNPRGSWGYGTEHGRAIKADMGNLDATDVLAFLDHCLASDDALDAHRLGIMGGSYGGYLTAWIIGHDHRFSGAIVERGFLDPWSFIGASDIGWFFAQEYTSYDKQKADQQSPMLYAASVRTPTLVIHSEQDLRCPLQQGLQYHALLKQAGVEAEMLVFPGENHELTRSGTPWHRRQRFEAVLAFWAKHLPVHR